MQIKVHNLHGRNYVFSLEPTSQPIVPQGSFAVASKTKKNVLITLQVRPALPFVSVPVCGQGTAPAVCP